MSKALIVIGVLLIITGLIVNAVATQKMLKVNEFMNECNEFYQEQFQRVCAPHPSNNYFIGFQPINWTPNLTFTE